MDSSEVVAARALASSSSAHKRVDELKAYSEKEIGALRDDRHDMHDAIHRNANQISLIIRDNTEIRKVVLSNTEAMNALAISSNEINTTFKTLGKIGKFLTWVMGLFGGAFAITKLLSVLKNVPIQ